MALNVLIVDDSAVMRSMIIKTLRLSGIRVGEIHQAGNGVEGLEKLSENWIDLALVDINMPVMNGEEMIDKVRKNPVTADLPVIVVSTESSETRIDALLNLGTQFIHKPFTPEILKEKILSMIGEIDGQEIESGASQSSGYDF